MTLVTAMLSPTNFLQNHYLDLVEYERSAKIGKNIPVEVTQTAIQDEASGDPLFIPKTRKEPFEIAVRITSLTNAILQFICATIETLPVLAVTTIIVLFNATNSGFVSQDGGRMERFRLASFAALASMWTPVGTSLWAVFNPAGLSVQASFVHLPSVAQASLLSFTLPSLPRLADSLGPDMRVILENTLLMRNVSVRRETAVSRAKVESTRQRKRDAESKEIAGAGEKVDLLERADITAYEWRTKLIQNLVEHIERDPGYLYNHFDISSREFGDDLRYAVQAAKLALLIKPF